MNHHILTLTLALALALPAAAQRLTATSMVVDCGQVQYRRPVTATFELKTAGRKTVHVKRVEAACGCTAARIDRQTIKDGEAATLTATYDAAQMGHFCKVIAVHTEGNAAPLTLQIKGIVVEEVKKFAGDFPYKIGTLLADANEIEFDDVEHGQRPQQTFHIYNGTSQPVEPVIMHLPNYLSANVSPSRLAPGEAAEVVVTLQADLLAGNGLTQTSVYLGSYPGDKVGAAKELPVSAILLPNFSALTESERANAPVAATSNCDLNFPAAGKKTVKAEVEITNKGRSELVISNVDMSSTGMTLSLGKSRLQPGESTKLKISIDTRVARNAHPRPRVLMITNDPARPKITVKVGVK